MSEISKLPTKLGREVTYPGKYDPSLLEPIPRQVGRDETRLQFDTTRWYGEDIWNVYELSWLSSAGKPEVAIAEIRVPASSPYLIESKSLKLYCNSFNMTRFRDAAEVSGTMTRDLSRASEAEVTVKLTLPGEFGTVHLTEPQGTCIDDQEITDFIYTVDAGQLNSGGEPVEEQLFSRLFRSCCPVTGQPDWATLTISYRGLRIDRTGLLRYLVSYREHAGFHEACVEKIFDDLMLHCKPDQLAVSARFTRRGGIDINPVRSTAPGPWANSRDPRQ